IGPPRRPPAPPPPEGGAPPPAAPAAFGSTEVPGVPALGATCWKEKCMAAGDRIVPTGDCVNVRSVCTQHTDTFALRVDRKFQTSEARIVLGAAEADVGPRFADGPPVSCGGSGRC